MKGRQFLLIDCLNFFVALKIIKTFFFVLKFVINGFLIFEI